MGTFSGTPFTLKYKKNIRKTKSDDVIILHMAKTHIYLCLTSTMTNQPKVSQLEVLTSADLEIPLEFH